MAPTKTVWAVAGLFGCAFSIGCSDDKAGMDRVDGGDPRMDASSMGDAGTAVDAGGEPSVSLCEGMPQGKALTSAEVSAAGPHKAGMLTLSLADTTRSTPKTPSYDGAATRTLATNVWYPAKEDGTLADGGPFPLLLWSHGFSSTSSELKYAAEHVATRGYIFAAPTYPLTNLSAPGGPQSLDFVNQPLDVKFVLDSLLAESSAGGTALKSSINADKIALGGLSIGASLTVIGTFHRELRDERVKAAFALATPGQYFGKEFFGALHVPLLLAHGDLDAVVPFGPATSTLWKNAPSPLWFVTIAGGTHTGFIELGASVTQPDSVGCYRITQTNTMQAERPADVYEMLGGTQVGFTLDPPPPEANAVTCMTTPLPDSISGKRQQALTTLLLTAFLDARFAADAEQRNLACQFLEQGAPQENPELRVRAR